MNRDTGKLEWTSTANQPGNYFFGYSYYKCDDGSRLLLMACTNGLHAMSSETCEDVWWAKQSSTGGITPCVDQRNGLVYYQCDGKVLKMCASDGRVLKEVRVAQPHKCISWNTVLVNDSHGDFVATRWYGKPEWDSAIRVYDKDLNLAWERIGLPNGKKDTLTYAEGKLVCGSGNGWSKKYTGNKWKHITAYSIAGGEVVWKCDLAFYAATGRSVRKVEPSPFPPSFADAGHNPDALRAVTASLTSKADGSNVARKRIRSLKTRLQLIEESRKYEVVLDCISADTQEHRELSAPEWALAQRDCMARLRNWVYYWIDHQQPDGQFGGGYEDDVELVCGWPVLALAQDDAKVRRSLQLLSRRRVEEPSLSGAARL